MIPDQYKEKVIKGKSHWIDRDSPVKTFVNAFKKEIGDPKGAKVLDIGCAQGEHTKELSNFEMEATGLDNNPDFIKEAKENYPELRFDVGEIEKLPYEKETFDAVYCINTLFYTDPKKSLPQLEMVLKKGGLAFITLNKQIFDIDKNKVFHSLDVDEALKIFKNCKIISKTYKERTDDSPFKHKHFFYEIILIKNK